MTTHGTFPTDVTGLSEAAAPEVVELADGASYELVIGPVKKRIGDATVRMLAYNGSIPGPALRVREGSTVTVGVENRGDLEATVHWHGLRLQNRYDGTHETQRPMQVGERFSYVLDFPDPGVYWYHPHIREDYGQELGLYGNIVVVPDDADYWPPVDRELAVTLDDVLIEEGRIAPFDREETTYVAMGRFGNTFLVNGDPELALAVRRGEVVRFYFTNTANTRVFNVAVTGARMKLVGGDSGRVEHEQLVDSILLAPSERVVVDVLFDQPGKAIVEHVTPDRTYRLATVAVAGEAGAESALERFETLRTNADLLAERDRIAPLLDAPPQKTIAFVAEMDLGTPEGPVVYACPMHPEVVTGEPGTCPKCGMKLLAVAAPPVTYACPMHPEVVSAEPGHCPKCGMKLLPSSLVGEGPSHGEHDDHGHAEHDDHGHAEHGDHGRAEHGGHEAHGGHGVGHDDAAAGIEWEDDMVDVNRMTTPANMRWKVVDRETGAEGHAIDWRFRVGDRVKIRLVNEPASDHPMHHPFHVHGAGRFLILARDGVAEPNLVWKDTVLVRTGETVDILLDVTNPGLWMAHCHIAEHHESGMMFSFRVDPADVPIPGRTMEP